MSSDYTFQQTPADQQRSKDLSLQRTRPPAEVPGYQTQRFLGAGAYGEVWVGLDRNTGRKVAIKYYLHRRGVDWSLLVARGREAPLPFRRSLCRAAARRGLGCRAAVLRDGVHRARLAR